MAGSRARGLTAWVPGRLPPQEPGGQDRREQRTFLWVLGLLLGASVVAAAVLTRWGIDWRASISYPQVDGLCDPVHEAVRGHCWGDYAGTRFESLGSPVAGAEAVYPLANRLLRLPFARVESAFGFHVSLAAWLAGLLAAMVGPIIWATWRLPWTRRTAAILVCGLCTMPTIVVLDRGNAIGLAVPAMLAVGVGAVRDCPLLAAAGVVAASAVKPQFALVLVVLVALRWWRPALVAALGIAVVVFVPPLIAGGRGIAGSMDWIRASMSWSGERSTAGGWPVNVSLAHAFDVVGVLLSDVTGFVVDPHTVERVAQISAVALVAVTIGLLMWRGPRIRRQFLVAAALCSASLVVPIAYAYYLVFAIALCALYLAYGTPRMPGSGRTRHGWMSAPTVLRVALVLSLTPLVLPGSGPKYVVHWSITVVESAVPVLAALAWATVLVQTCLLLVLSGKDVPDAAFGV